MVWIDLLSDISMIWYIPEYGLQSGVVGLSGVAFYLVSLVVS